MRGTNLNDEGRNVKMRSKIFCMILMVTLVVSNFTVFAAAENGDKSKGVSQQKECSIRLVDVPEQVNTFEQFTVTAQVYNVPEEAAYKARWLYNGQPIEGFGNDHFIVTEGKTSTLIYAIPMMDNIKTGFTVGFELINPDNKATVAQKEIKVSQNPLDLNIQLDNNKITLFKGDTVQITATVGNNNGKTYVIPVGWQKNDAPLDGCTNNHFNITESRTSTYFFYAADEYMNTTVKLALVINPENLGGILQKAAVVNINVIDHPPEYYEELNRNRVLSIVKPVNVEATVIKNANLYQDENLKTKIGQVNNGATGIYDDYHEQSAAHIVFPDGTSGWIPYGAVSISNKNYTVYEDFTDQDKETFVNAKGYSSDTAYLVWINLERQKVNVFIGNQGNWKLCKSMPCASGKNTTPTIAGIFKYSYKVAKWDFGDYYVKPVLVFNGGHAFHSRTYREKDGSLLDPTIGTPASHGCIRMLQEDIDWLAYYLTLKSTVVVF